MGIVYELIVGRAPGRDGVVRAAKAASRELVPRASFTTAVPPELACDRDTGRSRSQLNPDAEAFTPKQTRRAAQEARDRIAAVTADAEEDFEQSLC